MDRKIRATALAIQLIPHVDNALATALELSPAVRSIGILTTTIDISIPK
ncbi:ethanolamine utilization microcompartment shell protein EutL [Paenibacillus sp. DS2015]